MWTFKLFVLFAAFGGLVGPEHANAVTPPQLTQAERESARDLYVRRGCVACHQHAEITHSPSLTAVSEKYATVNDAVAQIKKSLGQGSRAKWGPAEMPPQTHVSGKERDLLARWVLNLHHSKETLPTLNTGNNQQPSPVAESVTLIETVTNHVIKIRQTPFVFRTYLPGITSRAIAVGLPGRISYAFDADNCRLVYAWEGGFLDASASWASWGGGVSTLLGEKFYVAKDTLPPGLGQEGKTPTLQFKGYTLENKLPVFRYLVDGRLVEHRITIKKDKSVQHHFTWPNQQNSSFSPAPAHASPEKPSKARQAATAKQDAYSVESLAVPGNISLEVSGLDYAADGTLYICTRRGDVWAVKDNRWNRFAWGLHEPMGLCITRAGRIFVSQRPEVTELIDINGDTIADHYNTFCDGFSSVQSFHQYTYGLVEDKEGNLCGTLSCTGKADENGKPATNQGFSSEPYRMWSFKISPAGTFIPWSSGLRTANGIGINSADELFAADNQGEWVGSSMLHHLSKGSFHGHPRALQWDKTFAHHKDPENAPVELLDTLRKMPVVVFPHGELANSPGAPVFDNTNGRFGPFAGQLFIGDIVHPRLIRVALDKVNGQYQGACFPFIEGGALRPGICRLNFSPEGDLIVGRVGEGDWARGAKGKGLQKIVFTGKTPFDIHSITLRKEGFLLQLTKPVDEKATLKTERYKITEYHYAYHDTYGSPKKDLRDIVVKSVEISKDKKTIFLRVDRLTPRKVYDFSLPELLDASGSKLRHHTATYTLNELSPKPYTKEKKNVSTSTRAFFPYVPSISDSKKRSADEQAALYRELGYAGVGELAQELGFMNFGHPKGITIPQRVVALEKHGLRLFVASGSIKLNAEIPVNYDTVKKIMPALARGKTTLAFAVGGDRKENLDAKAVEVFTRLVEIAKPFGVPLAIYPHAGDYTQTIEEAVRIAAEVNQPEELGVIFNLYHWMKVDRSSDLKTVLKNAKPWLKMVNINGSAKNEATIVPLDQSDFDVKEVFNILDEINYQGPVGLFCYSIKGDAKIHLTSSMTKWKSLTQ